MPKVAQGGKSPRTPTPWLRHGGFAGEHLCDENRYIAQLHLVAHSVCTLCVATAHAGQKWELPPVNPRGQFLGGRRIKTPLDPLFAVDSTNLGGEKLPMSIEAVVHAEDAGCRGYDSVGTLLSKPRQSVVCSALIRSPKAFFVTFCRLGQKVSKKPFEGVFVPSKWLRFSL